MGILAVIVLLAACVMIISFLMQWLAKENIFVTTVREGTVKVIMRGDSLDHFVMSFAGYHLSDQRKLLCTDSPEWEVIYHGKGQDEKFDDRPWWLKKLGLYWVGWPWVNSVYVYGFEWNETYTDDGGNEKILPRSEATDFIYVADFTYAIRTEGAETQDRLPTDELTLVTVAIRNPYRALFSGEDWMRRVTAAINRHVRDFVGKKDFQDLISSKGDTDAFSAPIIKLNEKLPDDVTGKLPWGLQGKYGVEIRTADLQTIELSGEAKKQDQAATTKAYVAEQEAKAITLTGKADAKVIKMKGKREAEALDARLKVIKAHGATGEMLAQLDAMQESSKGAGNTVIWANNPFIPLAGMLKPTETKGGEKS
ncbi:MAG: SPFH domain-containing protein [Candidatus Paceibacterota bacterium]